MSEKAYQRTTDCLVAFGANQGDRKLAFEKAVASLNDNQSVDGVVCSKPIETEPVTGSASKAKSSSDPYLNACIRFTTTFGADELHQAIIDIETQLGRERKERWGPRTIDLDLLLFGDLCVDQPKLTIPHPRMTFRRFVLEPAQEVADEMVHPVSGLTIDQLLDHLNRQANQIIVVTDTSDFGKSIVEQLNANRQMTDWEISIVTETSDFIMSAGSAKLVAACFGDEPSHDLVRFAKNFAGPTLLLSVTKGLDRCVNELAAAIEAMNSHS